MSKIKSQQGAALLIFVLSLIIAGGTFLLVQLNSNNLQTTAENNTSASLAEAKEAVLAYAVSYYLTSENVPIFDNHIGHHGFIPCPETSASTEEGKTALNCGVRYTNQLGRFPWKTLEIAPLKDSSGECLWYAMSGSFTSNPRALMLNDDTPGMFEVYNQNGSLVNGATPEDRVVAVIIAPGAPVSGQKRISADSSIPCKVARGQVVASSYLDSFLGFNNAAVSDTTANAIDQFISSNGFSTNNTFNDRIITITSAEIFDAIKSRPSMYDTKISDLGLALGNCLANYAVQQDSCGETCYADNNCTASDKTLCEMLPDKKDQKKCLKKYDKCLKDCRKSCNGKGKVKSKGKPPKGGGTPATHSRLPWPALIDLNADYRDSNNYIDDGSEGLFGRFPYITTNSSNAIGIPDVNPVDTCLNSEMKKLWNNWKDHWFYVIGSDFKPDAAEPANPCATNCPEINGTRYPGILIFSDERINNQLRRTNEIDAEANSSKAILGNYLEGNNATNHRDNNGDKTYGTGSVNDRHFCIKTDMTVVECP